MFVEMNFKSKLTNFTAIKEASDNLLAMLLLSI